jgi:hypothetical protein
MERTAMAWRTSHGAVICLAIVSLFLLLMRPSDAQDSRDRGGAYRRQPSPNTVRVGQPAPDFDLVRLDSVKTEGDKNTGLASRKNGGDRVKLSSFRGKKPVVLIFSSYT